MSITFHHLGDVIEESLSPQAPLIPPERLKVIRRNGKIAGFDRVKISVALTKAFLSVEGGVATASARIRQTVEVLTEQVCAALLRNKTAGQTFHIEDIQDQVELALMRAGEQRVAHAYVVYREKRAELRAQTKENDGHAKVFFNVVHETGVVHSFEIVKLKTIIEEACNGVEHVSVERTLDVCLNTLFDGMKERDIGEAIIMGARQLVELEPNYKWVVARLLLDKLRGEVLTFLNKTKTGAHAKDMQDVYENSFAKYIHEAFLAGLLDERLRRGFSLDVLASALVAKRDLKFGYLGLQTLYDRYFLRVDAFRIELPQFFFMRVAMGLAIGEIEREKRAIEFYDLLSTFRFVNSTPTLFNSGTLKPQLSSCYLTTIPDDLDGIFNSIKENALLSKFSGGLGNDWTRVRALGARIRGTNGESQGVIPFMKVVNDTAVAVNQGGKRKGAVCAYLECWHQDIQEFIELRKNTGDDRRRTHDMNTAVWIPDLFMKRVEQDAQWTLFSPDETGELHDLYGEEFEARYEFYEELARMGKLRHHRVVLAVVLWRKILGMLYETGHPWITFKDTCNLRSPQKHDGVVHSSNLCTEITLNTSDEEIAVCNLGSINLPLHMEKGVLSDAKIRKTVMTAIRILDNVIDLNYYAVNKARNFNVKHRPVGIGVMGFQDALYEMRVSYQSDKAIQFADRCMETISYCAIDASSRLARERGSYSTFKGSLWSKGILPIHSLQYLAKIRGDTLEVNVDSTLGWDALAKRVKRDGMRNSNVMAIAPTATLAGICGVSQSIEPTYQNLYVRSNLSGEFTMANSYLVKDLRSNGLWDEVMVNDLKYFNGSIQDIDRIPQTLKDLYLTAFEIDQVFLVEAAARRQKWIDQSQSLNIYARRPSGKMLSEIYKLAWRRGLKTTYYLRSLGATHVEKSTLERTDGKLNAVVSTCFVSDNECEACQ